MVPLSTSQVVFGVRYLHDLIQLRDPRDLARQRREGLAAHPQDDAHVAEERLRHRGELHLALVHLRPLVRDDLLVSKAPAVGEAHAPAHAATIDRCQAPNTVCKGSCSPLDEVGHPRLEEVLDDSELEVDPVA